MSVVQSTLSGGEADAEREKPDTLLWCHETQQYILRSRRHEWPYELYESREAFAESLNNTDGEADDDDGDAAERVGGLYNVTLSYTVDYSFTIPAWRENEAKERAELLATDATPSRKEKVHTTHDEVKELFEDSEMVPDGFDPYGNTPLWEAVEEADDDAN